MGSPEVQEAGGHEVVFRVVVLALRDLGLRLACALERGRPGDARVRLRWPFRVRGSSVVGVRGSH